MLRTFIAIDLPSPILAALAATQTRVQNHLRAVGDGGDAALRWSPIENLHLTLRFLGDTTASQRDAVTVQLRAVAAQVAPFTLQVDGSGRGLGGFPNLRQPRVVWAGVGGELVALKALQAQVEGVVQAAGFAPEEKPYTPHLTLARATRGADKRALVQAGAAIANYVEQIPATEILPTQILSTEILSTEVLSFQVEQVLFYQSELRAGASHYHVLAVLPLAGV